LGLGLGSGSDLVFKLSSSVVFAGNATDVMLTDDQDDNSSLFANLLLLLAMKIYPC